MELTESVAALLKEKFGVDPHSVRPEVPLHQLGMDSLALEELRLLIEDRLDLDLEDAELTSRATVEQLLALVRDRTVA
ncbi:acyl carrier protein [Saccharopolyspora gloriosae]|uniref:acyl carrier protein n=1 Tax=Saccharopolyspora gloriosae TaxID=455344 RepID=UPI001FB7DCA8|nr:acyl carrier protein [Saccharopolyspora gloriosae]